MLLLQTAHVLSVKTTIQQAVNKNQLQGIESTLRSTMAIPSPNITISLTVNQSLQNFEPSLTSCSLKYPLTRQLREPKSKLVCDMFVQVQSIRATNSRYITREVSIKGKYRDNRYKTFVAFHLAFQTSEYSRSSISSQSKA